MAFSISKAIESRVFEVDKDKVEIIGIALSLEDDNRVILGNQPVYRGRNLEDARQYYNKLGRSIEQGNYRLVIDSSLNAGIKID